jgi:hypothetical protein
VVSSNDDRVVGAQEVRVSALEAVDYGGHFFIVDIVVSLCWEKGMGMKGYGMPPVLEFLTDHCSKGKVWCIGIHKELFGPIWGPKYGVQAA